MCGGWGRNRVVGGRGQGQTPKGLESQAGAGEGARGPGGLVGEAGSVGAEGTAEAWGRLGRPAALAVC